MKKKYSDKTMQLKNTDKKWKRFYFTKVACGGVDISQITACTMHKDYEGWKVNINYPDGYSTLHCGNKRDAKRVYKTLEAEIREYFKQLEKNDENKETN